LAVPRPPFGEPLAESAQEPLPVAPPSSPGCIPDRSTGLADPTAPSPAPAMAEILRRLDAAGCAVAGIPCNTAHAPVLYNRLVETLAAEGRRLRLLHIADAMKAITRELAPAAHPTDVLPTTS